MKTRVRARTLPLLFRRRCPKFPRSSSGKGSNGYIFLLALFSIIAKLCLFYFILSLSLPHTYATFVYLYIPQRSPCSMLPIMSDHYGYFHPLFPLLRR